MTKRCPMCGKKMTRTIIDGQSCRQCPQDTCRWVEPIGDNNGSSTAETKNAAEAQK